jgi:ABC-type glycerol-3-phosphate transport system substrate-binding protein
MRLVLALVILALLALPACGGSDEDGADTGAVATSGQNTDVETTTEATTEETTTQEQEQGPTKISIKYVDGKLSGDTGTVRIEQGAQVRLMVRADIEDEVHLHGYDLAAEVAPGHPARIDFEADDAGKFIAELESLELHIVTLRVR